MDQGDPVGIGAQEGRLPHALVVIPDHRHRLVDRLIAVADRTDADQRPFDGPLHARQVRVVVDHPGGQQNRADPHPAPVQTGGEAVAVALQLLDPPRLDDPAILHGLLGHPLQDGVAGDPVREARHIVADGDPASPRRAAVSHQNASPEAGEIGRRGQAGRARADDQDFGRG